MTGDCRGRQAHDLAEHRAFFAPGARQADPDKGLPLSMNGSASMPSSANDQIVPVAVAYDPLTGRQI
jgi:hypothetical protein